jgi:hypothetical protein
MKKQIILLVVSLFLLVGVCSTQQMRDGGSPVPLCGDKPCVN